MLKKYGFVPDKLVTNELRSYIMLRRPLISGSQDAMSAADGATIERIIRVSQPDEAKPRCRVQVPLGPAISIHPCSTL
jgi:hypothetical protein